MSIQIRDLPPCDTCGKELVGKRATVDEFSGGVFCNDECVAAFVPSRAPHLYISIRLEDVYTRQFSTTNRIRD